MLSYKNVLILAPFIILFKFKGNVQSVIFRVSIGITNIFLLTLCNNNITFY